MRSPWAEMRDYKPVDPDGPEMAALMKLAGSERPLSPMEVNAMRARQYMAGQGAGNNPEPAVDPEELPGAPPAAQAGQHFNARPTRNADGSINLNIRYTK